VVVWDNLKAYQARAAARAVRRAETRLVWLPPYSPDYNPIEQLWSNVEVHLQRAAARTKDDVYAALGDALDGVRIREIIVWYKLADHAQRVGKPLSSHDWRIATPSCGRLPALPTRKWNSPSWNALTACELHSTHDN
jgi:hypothetical protein